jgi:predicted negative regulator of RcsB-dependent stress response
MPEEIIKKNFQNNILNFAKKNLKKFLLLFAFFITLLFIYFLNINLQKKNEIKLSEQFTQASVYFKQKEINKSKLLLEGIIDRSHKFYSPLALYFVIDNKLEIDPLKIINLFDKVLKINSIDTENLNLIKIKKAIFLFSAGDEEAILKTLNPVINSNSIWRNTAIKLMSDYFISKNQKKKANEYFQLLNNKINK